MLSVVAFVVVAARSDAQSAPAGATISGRVLDSLDKPVVGAEVLLEGTPKRAVSAENGTFTLSGIGVGNYRLSIRRVGFEASVFDARITGPDTLEVAVVLKRAAQTLDTVRATARPPRAEDFEANQKLGFGTFITRKDIERQAGSSVYTLLLSRIRGFSNHVRPCGGMALASSTVAAGADLNVKRVVGVATNCPMPDLCYVQLYVDGMRMFGTDHFSEPPDINQYPLHDLEGIEVYKTSAATPARYNRSGSVCGTLVLWKRR